ncbi:hypothetical protein H2200_012826 [Cladophialophora chaetospira]|uniref:Cell wall mannoprotein PIR1-like C-terminal domain-containing protein n=1 Tax=Cladophialophora chaetospira TaxID=386627 RepID=A0AA38WWW5_9EURO|nr:hypothetical protein H2200_012826 [Cladophialophora chaetospira]
MIPSCLLLVVYVTYVYTSPISPRQAVTALISPPSPPPPGCTGSFPSVFGIAVINITLTSSTPNASQTLQRRQQPPLPIFTGGLVDEIVDGQVQCGLHTVPISIEASTPAVTLSPVTQIGDGQIQESVQPDLPDARVEETGTTTVTICGTSPSLFPQLVDATLSSPASASFFVPTVLASPIPSSSPESSLSTTDADSSLSSGPTPSPSTSTMPEPLASPRLALVSCLSNSTLRLTLEDNNLHDAFNRTGYIASNYQFQFDGPPQSGAIWTSGWSICPISSPSNSNGTSSSANDVEGQEEESESADKIGSGVVTLALGGTTTFWQCLSGSFYNLYTENWAAQCNPVELRATKLVDCGE